jgi:hypothetical protein
MTILFKDDWLEYPEAIIDTKTSNEHFIRLSAIYRDMGIENHAFLLALHNPELQGVDPFDYKRLTPDLMMLIAAECKDNFWYFLREIARIPGSDDNDPIRYRAHRGNIALYWLYMLHVATILIQPRQTGKSYGMDTMHAYNLNIGTSEYKTNLLTKDDTLRTTNLIRLKDIIDTLPFYLKTLKKRDISNGEKIIVSSLNNFFEGHLPNKSPKAALLVGRGLTGATNHIDEIAFIYNLSITLPAMLSSAGAARDLAERRNMPYCNVFTTTAGKKDDPDGKYAYDFMQDSASWTEKFLDCKNRKELVETIQKASRNGSLRVNCTFSHRQLGYTDEWLREKLRESNSKGEDADRDYFNIWTSGGLSSPLSISILERIRASEKKDPYVEIAAKYNYVIRWYIPKDQIDYRMKSSYFSMGLDTSEAAGSDDIAMVIRDIYSGEVIAAATINETNLILFCQWLTEMFIRFKNFILIPERRSTGTMIIDFLLLMLPEKGINPFRRIFNTIVNNSRSEPDIYKEMESKTRYNLIGIQDYLTKVKKVFGFATSGSGMTARSALYSITLNNAASMTADCVNDKKTIDQICSLQIRNNRVDHPDGEHDDLCIAWLLSYWLPTQGENLSYYGVDVRQIMSKNQKYMIENDPKKLAKIKEQNIIKDEINQLVESMKSEKNDFIVMKDEMRLKFLISKLSLSDNSITSIDQLLHSIKEQRSRNKRSNIR